MLHKLFTNFPLTRGNFMRLLRRVQRGASPKNKETRQAVSVSAAPLRKATDSTHPPPQLLTCSRSGDTPVQFRQRALSHSTRYKQDRHKGQEKQATNVWAILHKVSKTSVIL